LPELTLLVEITSSPFFLLYHKKARETYALTLIIQCKIEKVKPENCLPADRQTAITLMCEILLFVLNFVQDFGRTILNEMKDLVQNVLVLREAEDNFRSGIRYILSYTIKNSFMNQ
jgi:hypothetical protein